jgi:hypothetical protein
VDWRDIIVALRIAVHPLEPPPDRLRRSFQLYSDDSDYMNRDTLLHMMTVTLYATEAVERVAASIEAWLDSGEDGPKDGIHSVSVALAYCFLLLVMVLILFSFLLFFFFSHSSLLLPFSFQSRFMELIEQEWKVAEEEWMEVGPVKSVVHIDSFLLVMWHDWFQGMSPEMRLRVADDRQQQSLQIIQEAETRCSVRRAVKMWQRKTLEKCWTQFVYGCHLSHCDQMSSWHDTFRLRKRGVLRWRYNANAAARMGQMAGTANLFRELWLKRRHYGEWRHFWQRCAVLLTHALFGLRPKTIFCGA